MKTIHRRLTILIAAAALSLGAITTLLLVGARGLRRSGVVHLGAGTVHHRAVRGTGGSIPGGQSRPDQVFDVYVASLPAEEQERLHQGIPVYDDKELQRLLEGYTS